MRFNYLNPNIVIISLIAAGSLFGACSTGIERTKPITMTKTDLRAMAPTPEETLISGVKAPTLGQWEPGREFLVTDNRAALIFDSDPQLASSAEGLAGKTLRYGGVSNRMTPGGNMECVVDFTDGANTYRYSTGKKESEALSSISGLDIPMLLDLGIVASADSLLRGREVWTLSQLCYDMDGTRMTGLKFVPVRIESVTTGDLVFPFKVNTRDAEGTARYYLMNIKNNGAESRTFPSLFSLSDPKRRYPAIIPEVWKYIQAGTVRSGMTKDECKLALGNPTDVDTGHDWNQTVDLWHYSDGRWLRFSDGLLVAYRM